MTADEPRPDATADVGPSTLAPAVGGAGRLEDDPEFQAQLAEVRARLRRDAAPAGIDDATVEQAIEETVGSYGSASVRSFLAVLIERDIRNRLSLRTSPETVPG